MKSRKTPPLARAAQKSAVIAAILAAWWFLPQHFRNMFLPPLNEIAFSFVEMAKTGEMWKHIGYSLSRALAGFLIAEALSIPLGILLGWFDKAERYLDPLFQVMRNTSVLAIMPLFVMFMGVGETSKIAIIVWGTFFPTLIVTIQGVKNVDPLLIQSAQSMGISRFGLFWKVVLPGALPYILAGFRQSAGVALIILVGAEMLGANYGLGFMILHYQQGFLVAKMFAGILTLAVLGVLVNALIVKLEARLTRWQEKIAK
ncbi:MAG: ABC transporter permease [Clostridiales Family XIII bacterium]|jgi:NitT/TauT family transport system permease protein|nr:ABC transporter permease [Clostridiales Family XIII bacterium]